MFRKKPGGKIASSSADGHEEADPHLWLEDVEGARALAWVRAENARSLAELEGDARFKAYLSASLAIVNASDRTPAPALFGAEVRNFWQDERSVRGLWRRASLETYLRDAPQWTPILDFDALGAAEGENWVFAGATSLAPAHDRAIVALSRGGADAAVRREYSVNDQRFVEGGFAFDEAKGAVVWRDENTLFAAIADSPASATASGYPRIVRRVARGQPLADAPIIFEASAGDIGVWPISIFRDGRRHSFLTRALTFFKSEHYRLGADDKPVRLPLPLKSEIEGVLGDALIATLREAWRYGGDSFAAGDLIALDLKTKKAALVFRPAAHQALSGVAVSQSAILIELLDNVIARVVRLTRKGAGWHAVDIGLPGEGVAALGSVNAAGDDFFLTFESPMSPPTLFYVGLDGVRRAVRQSPARFNAAGVVMEKRHAKSSDGVSIPYFLIGRALAIRQGKAPTILYGYGGFEVPSTPSYSGVNGRLWLEQGGLYAIANIRGGGEFGPRWHQAALKEKRQQGFDDFFSIAEDLIRTGATTAKRLGAYGGSNGGLLMGVALTQRPDLFNALAIGVPLLDMLRYTELLAGSSWVGEYGDPALPAERAVLARYSPYHRLEQSRAYPRPFLFTSTRDDRVHPGHARKMAAKMKEFGYDFLYYENIEGGHGAAANQNQAAYRAALQYIYFSRQLMDNPSRDTKGAP